ncbi:MAG: hypothetical protein MJY43_05005 [Bacteroidales bacterium]|nr:hypothetical protein [Bacteroidales bacterium]
MGRKNSRRLAPALLILLAVQPLSFADDSGQRDSLVRLVRGSSVRMVTPQDGDPYRKAVDAVFLHNNTYLLCDTAFWYLNANVIKAKGHVRLKQGGTVLSSETLDYLVNEDLAQFRGGVVQLEDSSKNVLRTRILDYNTKDSLATFTKGGAMRDKDGQIIESQDGTYDSKLSLFSFKGDVNMFTDSIFIRSTTLEYHSDSQKAVFTSAIDFWHDGDMLSSRGGWFDKASDTFLFVGKVHALTEKQETWSDSLYYYQTSGDALMLGSAQVQDSLKGTAAFADHIYYSDSLSKITLTRRAAGAVISGEGSERDTLYMRADTISYRTFPKCTISPGEKKAAGERLGDIMMDPVSEYIKKAAEEAAKKAEEAMAMQAKGTKDRGAGGARKPREDRGPKEQTPPEEMDSASIAAKAYADSVAMADSIARREYLDSLERTDSTKVGFAYAVRNVRMFRKDMQVRCDSLQYCDLDSIARLYVDPTVWNEGFRQYTSDSLFILVSGGHAERASLMSEAFVATEEDSIHFDQIKSAEILAFFDTASALKRFDALGGALAIFYIVENDAVSTVNKVDSKMLSGTFHEGKIDRMYYYDSPKNDAYPVAQLPREEQYLKGFDWRDSLRPVCREDITLMTFRISERDSYQSRPRPRFRQTAIYFKGYMEGINSAIASSKAIRRSRPDSLPQRGIRQMEDDAVLPDSADISGLPEIADSVPLADSANVYADSLAAASVSDSLSTDSLAVAKPMTLSQIRAAQRDSARAAKWAMLDSLDAAKAAGKERKALERRRESTRKALIRQQRQERRDEARLEKYKRKFTKQKERRYGKDSGPVSEIRGDRHAVKRGERKPAFDVETADPAQSPEFRTWEDGR